jgi:hypothetical protein
MRTERDTLQTNVLLTIVFKLLENSKSFEPVKNPYKFSLRQSLRRDSDETKHQPPTARVLYERLWQGKISSKFFFCEYIFEMDGYILSGNTK